MVDDVDATQEDDVLLVDNSADTDLKERLESIRSRCEAAKIDFQLKDDVDFGISARISLPAGKTTRPLIIASGERAKQFLGIDFENIRFVPAYDAIWRPSDNTIEAAIHTTRLNPEMLIRRIQGKQFSEPVGDDAITLVHPSDPVRPAIEIARSSIELSTFLGRPSSRFSITIKNCQSKNSDQAVIELNNYANSVFFQIDLIYGYSFMLARERRLRPVPLSRKLRRGINIEYPISFINNDAASLYWYGKSARGMPLLQYLAYYQCIEFYFPRYSQLEARRRVSNILKRPTFRLAKDDDLDSVISAVQSTRANGFGSERNQLRAVINECMSAEDVRDYIEVEQDRIDHFSGRGSKSKFHKIPIANKSADLRNDVADRIYDIRCKIVHTKNDQSDENIKMILPFSEDADYLIEDIELVEFICRNVLSSSSSDSP